ncbi:unnamed protein product [Toxocara canis]|uniref:Cucumisin n=1 Tax=Toxocara canis TaxID=6265 RepID=A0A183V4R2_TOXCA|nr:unnamed protein product [Toxocara canis]
MEECNLDDSAVVAKDHDQWVVVYREEMCGYSAIPVFSFKNFKWAVENAYMVGGVNVIISYGVSTLSGCVGNVAPTFAFISDEFCSIYLDCMLYVFDSDMFCENEMETT